MIHVEEVIREVVESMQVNGLPRFMFGSPITLSNIVVMEKQVHRKYPVVILMDDIRQEHTFNAVSPIDKTALVQLFFMDRADPRWTSAEHMEKAVKPMRELMEKFTTLLVKDHRIHSPGNFETRAHTMWGLRVEADGKKKSVFPDWLSGVEMNLGVHVFKSIKCRK